MPYSQVRQSALTRLDFPGDDPGTGILDYPSKWFWMGNDPTTPLNSAIPV